MTTNIPSLWDSIFPTLPRYILPPDTPSFNDARSLIEFVRKNTGVLEDNWTDAIRQKGIGGRLRIMEDGERDEAFRSETLRRAIQSAQRTLLNT